MRMTKVERKKKGKVDGLPPIERPHLLSKARLFFASYEGVFLKRVQSDFFVVWKTPH